MNLSHWITRLFFFVFFFSHAESTGWVEAEISHIGFVCFEIWELKSKMFNIWWLLFFKLAQQERHHNAKTELENQIHQALVESLSIYVLAAVAKSSQFKPYIDVRIMLLVGTSILISCCATVGQNSVMGWGAWEILSVDCFFLWLTVFGWYYLSDSHFIHRT